MAAAVYSSFFPINLRPEETKYPLYFEGSAPTYRDGNPRLVGGQVLNVDGAMSSLYEREVYGSTGHTSFRLKMRTKGSLQIELFHTDQSGVRKSVANVVSGNGAGVFRFSSAYLMSDKDIDPNQDEHEILIDFDIHSTELSYGRWGFSATPVFGWAEIISAEWEIGARPRREVSPVFVICTFNRITQLQNNLTVLTGILESEAPNYQVIVVDNARNFQLLPEHLSGRLQVIPQKNVGGAGGFGRGIYMALSQDSTSHIILLDDDADIDAVSIARMLNIFRFMREELDFVGGVQMDVYDHIRLADASAYWRADRFETVTGRMPSCHLDTSEAKAGLSRNLYTNFNGWWLFGGSKAAFENNEMPLPIFVHLDDVDFGVRADIAGRRTWTVPGIAVWHEPYYAKVEGWFAFYNIRNELIRLSGQLPRLVNQMISDGAAKNARPNRMLAKRMRRVAKQLRDRYRNFISTNQYGSAYLLCMAVDRYLDGPTSFMLEDFDAVHQAVMDEYKHFNENFRKLDRAPIGRTIGAAQVSTKWYNYIGDRFYRYLQRHTFNGHQLPQLRANPLHRLPVFSDRMAISWTGIPLQSDYAYNDPADGTLHYYRFDKELFGEIHGYHRQVMRKYMRHCEKVSIAWADAYGHIISKDYWSKLIASFDA